MGGGGGGGGSHGRRSANTVYGPNIKMLSVWTSGTYTYIHYTSTAIMITAQKGSSSICFGGNEDEDNHYVAGCSWKKS